MQRTSSAQKTTQSSINEQAEKKSNHLKLHDPACCAARHQSEYYSLQTAGIASGLAQANEAHYQ